MQERASRYRKERLAVWDSLLKAKAIDEGLYRVRKEWIENLPDREVLRHYYPNDETLKFGMISYAYLFIVLLSVILEIIVSVLLF